MPWKEQRAMSLKIEFVERAQKGEKIAPLCREFGVSRTTGHKWLKRFKELGYAGLEDESRRPKTAPLAAAEDVVMAVLEARDAHPRWGPQKLRLLLKRRFGEGVPSERTVARILLRANRVRARRKRRPPNVVERAPQARAEAPNDLWTADFKGWWRAINGQRCEPLTVRDAFSRYVLTITLCRTKTSESRAVFEQLFKKHGLPRAIQCDNGIPFVSVRSPGGLSALSAWWTSLGIQLVRSRPGCPQDNGGHERMHRDIRCDVQTLPAENLQSQQRLLDRWRQEFNHVRPHQALGGKTPAELYTRSERRLGTGQPYEYPAHFLVVKLGKAGRFYVHRAQYFLSASLAGHRVAFEPVDAFHVRAWFHDLDLGLIEIAPDIDDLAFEAQHRQNISKEAAA
jgi:putative transposase